MYALMINKGKNKTVLWHVCQLVAMDCQLVAMDISVFGKQT